MTKGQRNVLKIKPSYGFQHPHCKMPVPHGVPPGQLLTCRLELVDFIGQQQARPCGADHSLIKQLLSEGSKWESARPPFEVRFHITVRSLAHDGIQRSGRILFTTQGPSSGAAEAKAAEPAEVSLGAGQVPPGAN